MQAICSLPAGYQSSKYQSCVKGLLELDTTCIPGTYGDSGVSSLGVTGTATTTTTGTGVSTGWTTVTARAEDRRA